VILVQKPLGNVRGGIELSPGCGVGIPLFNGLGHEV
jgi:hypothetical protein